MSQRESHWLCSGVLCPIMNLWRIKIKYYDYYVSLFCTYPTPLGVVVVITLIINLTSPLEFSWIISS